MAHAMHSGLQRERASSVGPLSGDLSSQKKYWQSHKVGHTRAAAGSAGEALDQGEIGPEVQIYSSIHSSAIVSHSNVTLQKQLQTSDERKGYVTVSVHES